MQNIVIDQIKMIVFGFVLLFCRQQVSDFLDEFISVITKMMVSFNAIISFFLRAVHAFLYILRCQSSYYLLVYYIEYLLPWLFTFIVIGFIYYHITQIVSIIHNACAFFIRFTPSFKFANFFIKKHHYVIPTQRIVLIQ